MSIVEKHIEISPFKEMYLKSLSQFTEGQKAELEDLVIRLDNAGAKNPLQWAISEIEENIPQFGRFLVLKRLFKIANSPMETISMAEDFDDEIEDKYQEICRKAGKELMSDFLKSFSMGVVWNAMEVLDEGNRNADDDKVSWVLMRTDEDGNPTEQIIEGLHEDFIEFENEVK